MTQCQDEFRILSGRTQKLKVAKRCWKQWSEHNLMYIYHKWCENMQKIQWKCSNDQLHRSYKRTSMTFWSSLLKTMKTRQTKTYINQNFELVWPIQGRTMWKLTSWRFRKCGTFWGLKVLNQSYWLSKSSEISKKKSASQKKRSAKIMRIEARNK